MDCRCTQGMVSVIVPAYNSEKFITNCIDSILNSTYKNIEIIVVNDGSTDNTKAIMEDCYSEQSNVTLICKSNGGVSSARNIGLDSARGEYVMFVDADDMIYPETIEVLLKYLEASSADITCGNCIESNNFSDDCIASSEIAAIDMSIWEGNTAIQKAIDDHPATYSAWAKLYKKDIIANTRFVEGKRIHEDSFFVFEILLKRPRMIILDVPVYKYRVHSNSSSRSDFSDKFFDIMFFAEKKEELIVRNYPEFADRVGNIRVKANMALLRNLCKTYDKKYVKHEKQAIKNVILNRKSFIPAIRSDKKFFYAIIFRLYWLYKMLFYLKRNKYLLKFVEKPDFKEFK